MYVSAYVYMWAVVPTVVYRAGSYPMNNRSPVTILIKCMTQWFSGKQGKFLLYFQISYCFHLHVCYMLLILKTSSKSTCINKLQPAIIIVADLPKFSSGSCCCYYSVCFYTTLFLQFGAFVTLDSILVDMPYVFNVSNDCQERLRIKTLHVWPPGTRNVENMYM